MLMIKKKIKFLIIPLIACMLLYESSVIKSLNLSQNKVDLSSSFNSSDMTLMAENKNFMLYYSSNTTDISVVDKKSGNTWNSIPRSEDIASASDEIKAAVSSLVSVNCYDIHGAETVLMSYDYLQQIKVTPKDNGMKVIVHLGRTSEQSNYPSAITSSRMNEVVAQINDNWQQKKVLSFYNLISKDTCVSKEKFENYKLQYPILSKENIYVLSDDLAEREITEIEEIFNSIGYTVKNAEKDNEQAGAKKKERKDPYFVIPFEIELSDTGFTASIDVSSIEGNKLYNINTVTLLPSFSYGADNTDGFVFYPDGSGEVIDFGKNGKTSIVSSISKPIYGTNYAETQSNVSTVSSSIRIPVYGISRQTSGCFAIITQGDAIANIEAKNSTSTYPINQCYPIFKIKNKEEYNFGDSGGQGFSYTIFEKEQYKGKLEVNYILLTDTCNSLSGMANVYRTYLKDIGILNNKLKTDSIPFYYEALGSFEYTSTAFGISYQKKAALTTFEQSQEILKKFHDSGIDNLQLKYVGFANNGLYNKSYSKLKIESVLGGKSGFNKLIDFVKINNIGLFPDFELINVSKNTLFDKFTARTDAIRTLDKQYASSGQRNYSDGLEQRKYFRYVLSPTISEKYTKNMINYIDKYKLTGVSASSIGSSLSANYNLKNYVNRQEAFNKMSNICKLLSNNTSLMTSGGNYYTFMNSDHLLNIPLTSSNYSIIGYSVPFLAMILHGYKEYAGEPLNQSGDLQTAILNAAENGSGVYFVLSSHNSENLRQTVFSQYYSTNFSDWKDKAITTYNKLNEALSNVCNYCITDYNVLNQYVTRTVYENNISIIVNYGQDDYMYNGIIVPGRDFIKVAE